MTGAAYSGGTILSDPVLYNIRRERRCEFMAEGTALDGFSKVACFGSVNR